MNSQTTFVLDRDSIALVALHGLLAGGYWDGGATGMSQVVDNAVSFATEFTEQTGTEELGTP